MCCWYCTYAVSNALGDKKSFMPFACTSSWLLIVGTLWSLRAKDAGVAVALHLYNPRQSTYLRSIRPLLAQLTAAEAKHWRPFDRRASERIIILCCVDIVSWPWVVATSSPLFLPEWRALAPAPIVAAQSGAARSGSREYLQTFLAATTRPACFIHSFFDVRIATRWKESSATATRVASPFSCSHPLGASQTLFAGRVWSL
jgi:hypothetical protein